MIEKLLQPYIPGRFKVDRRYREWHIHVINPLPAVKVLGLHIPDMKKIAAALVREGKAEALVTGLLKAFTENPGGGLCYEEKMLWGMLLNRIQMPLEKRLEAFGRFIPAMDNWAVCDIVCDDAKWCRTSREAVWNFLQPYFRSGREFEVRFALVFSLAHFMDKEHIEALFGQIASFDYEHIQSDYECQRRPVPYYVNMAAAWLMATALYQFPEETRRFASSGRCPEHIRRLYLRKARESFRTRDIEAI